MALLAEDAFEFTQTDISVREETLEPLKPKFGISVEKMNEIRFFCIQLLRGEGLELWQKIAVLGLFCESLTNALKSGGHSRIQQIMDSTREIVTSGECHALFSTMQAHYGIQATTFTKLWHIKNRKRVMSQSQVAVHETVAKGLGLDMDSGDFEEAQLVEKYEKGIKNLPKFLSATPHLLENYILNEMWRECFPFDDVSPYEHYLRLVIRYGLVRFMLAAQCSQDDSVASPEFLTQTVQTFCRRYQHDTQFTLSVNTCFNNAGWSDLQKIYRLLII